MNHHDDDMEISPRPSKRRRRTSSRNIRLSDAEDSLTQRRYWFNDGDIVLEVDDQLFKVHRSILMCSLIFADMLELPQSENVENIDGCPSVKMPGDSARDWNAVLSWMYDRIGFARQPVVFQVLAGTMRISTKYEIYDLREWAKRELFSRWPIDLTKMNNNALPHAAEAICLARECDIPEILPAAFYALSTQRWAHNAEGGQSHLTLHPEDLRCFIAGRESLQDHLLNILVAPTGHGESHEVLCPSCEYNFRTLLIGRLSPTHSSPIGCWLLRELLQLDAFNPPASLKICPRCAVSFNQLTSARVTVLQDAIPRYFLL
ncbi:hypothetical protein BJ138DRAFT_1112858 [Hygrophoropsis aurantiaca]|uniref:Uncharacterized protein n=1 Tax=Hygrophoropsis aurantiaca TaxID=72124 RepID=A0ACB8AFF9_9AGAM|nr:hypothetical protein BJ138DRAFT_1112858 [Hygrophoropsis aurantiaca]